MGGQFTPYDDVRCRHYAAFTSHLTRFHFDVMYWVLFLLVIGTLFLASWIYQWTMTYRETPNYSEEKFRRKLKVSLGCSSTLFLVAAVLLVMEVYALLALQFCDGEDLMSLYWSTWTMLQLGSEIAILGIVLALWHHLCDVKHPLWALALGTPVLVVAGFGHVISLTLEMFYKKAKARRSTRRASRSGALSEKDVATSSSDTSIKPDREETEQRMRDDSIAEQGRSMYFTLDVGDDERVKAWPSFVGMSDGRAVVQLKAFQPEGGPTAAPLASGAAGPSRRS
ncbi:Uu.00g008600.m01.CDS01 [Anthostomella pinea]|uniref:Uu.00g008600.m01.CDS01 n=1 Tax=Anthostomella pinea TaxID=933095 RepID=A0AAI8YPZ9_9PEZI|nr:Uu.00g008600.m01.CDS01 [Anthostomella pinea]